MDVFLRIITIKKIEAVQNEYYKYKQLQYIIFEIKIKIPFDQDSLIDIAITDCSLVYMKEILTQNERFH